MRSDSKRGKQSIASVTASASCKLSTRRGIRIGSAASQVRRLYAAEEDKETPQSDAQFVAGSIYGGLIFSFEAGRVSELFLGAAAE